MAKSNGFAPIVPTLDVHGRTAKEFLTDMFEFEYCPECGHDTPDHTAVIGPTGGWFAYCDKTPKENAA